MSDAVPSRPTQKPMRIWIFWDSITKRQKAAQLSTSYGAVTDCGGHREHRGFGQFSNRVRHCVQLLCSFAAFTSHFESVRMGRSRGNSRKQKKLNVLKRKVLDVERAERMKKFQMARHVMNTVRPGERFYSYDKYQRTELAVCLLQNRPTNLPEIIGANMSCTWTPNRSDQTLLPV